MKRLSVKFSGDENLGDKMYKNKMYEKLVEMMKEKGDLDDTNVVCIGDDDMVGLALALTDLPKKVVVIDADERIIEYERKIAEEIGLRLECVNHNLIESIPRRFKNKFDVFVTEPPDTIKGNTLFFSRGVECLKKEEGKVGYIGITHVLLSWEEWLEIEKNILKMDFASIRVIREKE